MQQLAEHISAMPKGLKMLAPYSSAAVGERIIQTREALGWTAARICRASGVAANTYSQWEKGRNYPRLDQAIAYCNGTGATLDWIYRNVRTGLSGEIAQGLPPSMNDGRLPDIETARRAAAEKLSNPRKPKKPATRRATTRIMSDPSPG